MFEDQTVELLPARTTLQAGWGGGGGDRRGATTTVLWGKERRKGERKGFCLILTSYSIATTNVVAKALKCCHCRLNFLVYSDDMASLEDGIENYTALILSRRPRRF